MSLRSVHSGIRGRAGSALLTAGAAWLLGFSGSAPAQSLNWEGQTGVFVTPLAYTAASPDAGAGKPVVAYHFLNADDVPGNFHTPSAAEGLFGRVEFGYTRVFHQEGSTPNLSDLWQGGFNIVHGKVTRAPAPPLWQVSPA
jgi:hypothetical protein